LRRQPPLPETVDQLCQVAIARGVTDPDRVVNLGERATEARVKALSADGTLARARIVHFATHGLVAGETALFAKNLAEPSLLLTPPEVASEEDDGLLTASEIATLKLDADWVILSACNTASGDSVGGDPLSGLHASFSTPAPPLF
jgi:CHAT domain-containing protein